MHVIRTATSNAWPQRADGENKPLTGLRGVAAFLVVLYHFIPNGLGADALSEFVRKGYIWVDLFFVLSGFILGLSFGPAFAATPNRRTYRTFLMRRFARIYPLYAIITAESAVAHFYMSEHRPGFFKGLAETVSNFTMIQAWGLAPSFEGAAWSISAEWAAYLIFPFLLTAAMSSRPAHMAGLGALALGAIFVLSMTPGLHLPDESRMGPLDIYSHATPAPVFRALAEFFLGLLAYRWFCVCRQLVRKKKSTGQLATPLCAGVLAAMMVPGTDPIIVALFPALIVSIACETSLVSRVLASAPVVWYGNISFSVYLVHGKFIRVIDWLDSGPMLHGWHVHLVSVAVSIVLVSVSASVTYYLIERPCRVFLRRALAGTAR